MLLAIIKRIQCDRCGTVFEREGKGRPPRRCDACHWKHLYHRTSAHLVRHTKEAVEAALAGGKTLREAGAILGISHQRVQQLVKKYGIERRPQYARVIESNRRRRHEVPSGNPPCP